jgi:hypothetical protein
MAVTPAAMAAAAPAHFLGLQLVGFFLGSDSGLRRAFRQLCVLVQGLRHQGHGLRTRGERRKAGDSTCSDPEKFAAFHESLLQSRVMRNEFRRADVNAR